MLKRMVLLCALVGLALTPTKLRAQEEDSSVQLQMQEILGGIIAAYIVESHTSIGLIADSYIGEVLDDEKAQKLVDMHLTLLNDLGPRIMKLSKNDALSADGLKFFKDSGQIFKSIRSQLESLNGYIATESDEDHKKFLTAREKAESKIDQFFNE